MFESGEIIYYKRPGDGRALRGEVVGQQCDSYIIKGMRTATKNSRPLLTIPASQILPVHLVRKPKKHMRENGNGAGLSVPVAESVRRSQVGAERLGMDEGAVLFADPMQQLCRRIVRRLASFNGIYGNDNPELHELYGEYLVAALQAVRTQTSKASEEELDAFRSFLAGHTVTSRIMLTVARCGKTAVIRFLKRRQKFHQTHKGLETLERRMAA